MTVEVVKEFLANFPKPKEWRNGQFVYNILYRIDHTAAEFAQFEQHSDCYYNDDKIDDFIKYWTKKVNSYE
ncbi:hypothetical protein [Intestinibacter sp.]|uniref:hypothetical protein n=1 Tax=Intestinibacter sp. TaxID=1965304 RepID=UPI003F18F8C7